VKKRTERDIGFGYLIGGLFYFVIGLCGSIGILGRTPSNPNP